MCLAAVGAPLQVVPGVFGVSFPNTAGVGTPCEIDAGGVRGILRQFRCWRWHAVLRVLLSEGATA